MIISDDLHIEILHMICIYKEISNCVQYSLKLDIINAIAGDDLELNLDGVVNEFEY